MDTDDGAEFKGVFDTYLEEQGIQHTIADERNKDARDTLDHAIKAVRPTLTRLQLAIGKKWFELVEEATHAWNHLKHYGLIGRAPEEVASDDDAKFLLTERAAADIQHNQKQIEARGRKLEQEGGCGEEFPQQKREHKR